MTASKTLLYSFVWSSVDVLRVAVYLIRRTFPWKNHLLDSVSLVFDRVFFASALRNQYILYENYTYRFRSSSSLWVFETSRTSIFFWAMLGSFLSRKPIPFFVSFAMKPRTTRSRTRSDPWTYWNPLLLYASFTRYSSLFFLSDPLSPFQNLWSVALKLFDILVRGCKMSTTCRKPFCLSSVDPDFDSV